MTLDIRELLNLRAANQEYQAALQKHAKALDKMWRQNKRQYCAKFRCKGMHMDWYLLSDGHVTERRALQQLVARGAFATMAEVIERYGVITCTEQEAKEAYGQTAGLLPRLLPPKPPPSGLLLGPDGNPIR